MIESLALTFPVMSPLISTEDQEIRGRDLAGERTVDPHLTLEVQLALEDRPRAKQGVQRSGRV